MLLHLASGRLAYASVFYLRARSRLAYYNTFGLRANILCFHIWQVSNLGFYVLPPGAGPIIIDLVCRRIVYDRGFSFRIGSLRMLHILCSVRNRIPCLHPWFVNKYLANFLLLCSADLMLRACSCRPWWQRGGNATAEREQVAAKAVRKARMTGSG